MSWNESINTTRMNAKNSSLNVNFFRLALSHTRFRWRTISVVVKPAMDVFIDFFLCLINIHVVGPKNQNSHINSMHIYSSSHSSTNIFSTITHYILTGKNPNHQVKADLFLLLYWIHLDSTRILLFLCWIIINGVVRAIYRFGLLLFFFIHCLVKNVRVGCIFTLAWATMARKSLSFFVKYENWLSFLRHFIS